MSELSDHVHSSYSEVACRFVASWAATEDIFSVGVRAEDVVAALDAVSQDLEGEAAHTFDRLRKSLAESGGEGARALLDGLIPQRPDTDPMLVQVRVMIACRQANFELAVEEACRAGLHTPLGWPGWDELAVYALLHACLRGEHWRMACSWAQVFERGHSLFAGAKAVEAIACVEIREFSRARSALFAALSVRSMGGPRPWLTILSALLVQQNVADVMATDRAWLRLLLDAHTSDDGIRDGHLLSTLSLGAALLDDQELATSLLQAAMDTEPAFDIASRLESFDTSISTYLPAALEDAQGTLANARRWLRDQRPKRPAR